MEWLPVNLDLLKNPLNWLIVLFMTIIALIPLALISEASSVTFQSPISNSEVR